jgi:hypothetical protein
MKKQERVSLDRKGRPRTKISSKRLKKFRYKTERAFNPSDLAKLQNKKEISKKQTQNVLGEEEPN